MKIWSTFEEFIFMVLFLLFPSSASEECLSKSCIQTILWQEDDNSAEVILDYFYSPSEHDV